VCGIFAVLCNNSSRLPGDAQARTDRALDAIRHRGPNARGTFIDAANRFAIGHVRLSVIDVSALANQPFWSNCGRYFVIFNGEIYNYVEIKADLEIEGETFSTHSDTEVLLRALMRWGPSAINRFNGMWTFVYGDTLTNQFVISRDRWGVKPLFTYEHDGMLVLCSEAKGILAWLGAVPKPNQHAIGLFLKYGIGGECEFSWFSGINRFPKSTYQIVDLHHPSFTDAPSVMYWQYPKQRTVKNLSDAINRFEQLLSDATKIRLRSDVPIGLSLSAGIDSATIAFLASSQFKRSLESYTAWHPPVEKSELPMAQRLAREFGHTSTAVAETKDQELVEDLRTCIYHLDSAHSSPAIVPYLNLCRSARKTLTVMLEGQGADELLAGYPQFALFAGLDQLLRGQLPSLMQSLYSNILSVGRKVMFMDLARFASPRLYAMQARRWRAAQLLGSECMNAISLNFRQLALSQSNLAHSLEFWHSENLANLLQYGDAVSMSVNLETRCPFLDYRLVEFCFSLDTQLLFRDGFGKYLLRKLVEPNLPKELTWRRKKDGFGNSTTKNIGALVHKQGLPSKPLEFAIEIGLFRPLLRDPRVFAQLSENIQFRIYSTLLWLDIFYGKQPAQSLAGK